MEFVRLNVSIPHDIFEDLSKIVKPRKRSRFITDAIRKSLKKEQDQRLAAEYEEAASEIRRINQELEGVISDGLD
jgi:metal-responsive CopG/Arc/MetJ family transcriptional regulator